MSIKPIQLSKVPTGISGAKKIPNLPSLAGKIPYFSSESKSNKASIENQLCMLRLKLADCQNDAAKIGRKLDISFGEDWLFCYGDLNEKQSDMYIEFFNKKDLASSIRKSIEKLAEKLNNL